MDLEKFHQLYNFRKRTPEELQALQETSRGSSSSRSTSRSSSTSSSSSSCSSRRSRSRSLPYSVASRSSSSSSSPSSSSSSSSSRATSRDYWSEDSDENVEAIDALLEAPYKKKRTGRDKGRQASKRARYSNSPSPVKYNHAVVVTQLSEAISRRDIGNLFTKVGKIQDILLIFCPKQRKFKGMARVEFRNIESVILALGLNGTYYRGNTIVVQPSTKEEILLDDTLMSPMTLKAELTEDSPIKFHDDALRKQFEQFGKITNFETIDAHCMVTYKRTIHALEAMHELAIYQKNLIITVISK